MAKIVATVGTPDPDDSTSYIVNWVLDGTMNMSTNIVILKHLSKLPLILGCAGCNYCRTGQQCPIKDDTRVLLDEIRTADVLVLGTRLSDGGSDLMFGKFLDRLLNQRIYLGLGSKKYILAVGSECSGTITFDFVNSLEKRLDEAGLHRLDHVIYIEKDGEDVRGDVALKNEANLIGGNLRNTYRTIRKSA